MKRQVIILITTALVMGGLYLGSGSLQAQDTTGKKKDKPVNIAKKQNPKSKEDVVKEKIETAQKNIKMVSTGCNSYHLDNNKFPDTLSQLTIHANYLKGDPVDPFNNNTSLRYKYIPNKESAAWKDDYFVWSIGPDEKDQDAKLIYDPTNGLTSSGDIVMSVRGSVPAK
jgi:hypothetical protein